MDYCVPCHRTLNGAVTCPECGAYDSAMAPTGEIPVAATGGIPVAPTGGIPVAATDMPGIRTEEPTAPEGPPADIATVPAPAGTATPPGPAATAPALAAAAVTAPARRPRPRRWRTYGGRTLAAAAFAVLGGLGTSSLLADGSAGLPQAAPSPDLPSSDGPREHGTARPTASAAPERPAGHPARGAARERDGGAPGLPRATPSSARPPAARTPAPVPDSAPPAVSAGPSARPSTGRPVPSPSPTAPTSPSPGGSTGASPTGSPSPSTSEVPVTDALPERAPLPAGVRRGAAGGAVLTGR
ncbi:SCO2400 family protein [Streptomyces wuyuanensis]|uniref:SCO2400 family protein n=1 Tax=Streptomyces wuyuanensis TaxID=1196353 RepID=UPI003F5402A0